MQAKLQAKMGVDPASVVARAQQPTIAGLAREYSAKAALRSEYERRAKRLGMSLPGYCQRFNIRGF